MSTFNLSAKDIKNNWYVIDAKGLVLGRLAVEIAKILRGKHKPTFSPHLNCGDNVIVVNAKHIALTGNKLKQKIFYWHTGYPGGIKQKTAKDILDSQDPTFLLRKAVQRMIGRGPLRNLQMTNLYIYSDNEHKHEAQMPMVLDIGRRNIKNRIRSHI